VANSRNIPREERNGGAKERDRLSHPNHLIRGKGSSEAIIVDEKRGHKKNKSAERINRENQDATEGNFPKEEEKKAIRDGTN